MDLSTQGLSHFPTTNVRNRVESQAVEQLVVIQQVLSYAVDDQVQELVLLVQEQGHGEVANLLFRVFVRRDEVDRLEVAEVDVPSEDVDVEELRQASAQCLCPTLPTKVHTLHTYFFL